MASGAISANIHLGIRLGKIEESTREGSELQGFHQTTFADLRCAGHALSNIDQWHSARDKPPANQILWLFAVPVARPACGCFS